MGNKNRIFYGSQIVQVKPGTPVDGSISQYSSWYQPLGVQSVGMTTNFETEQAFQLGALDIYNISENLPNVEVTISRLLDGRCPLYLMCMGGSGGLAGANLTNVNDAEQQRIKGFGGLSNNVVDFRLGIYDDSKSQTAGDTSDFALCEKMYLSSLGYTFPVDGTATEEITLVGNSKKWSVNNDLGTMTALDFNTTSLKANKLARRQFIDIEGSVLPTGFGGMAPPSSGGLYIQNISVKADLGRETINELGSFAPRSRYATFPVEVTSEFEVIGTVGDLVNAKDFLAESGCGINYTNLKELPIKLNVCGSGTGGRLILSLGSGNQLTSVNYAGGDTGGGNATITYSFRNYNDFYLQASGNYAEAFTVS